MPARGRGRSRSRSRTGRRRSGSGGPSDSDSKPATLPPIARECQSSSVEGVSGSKRKASEGAGQSVLLPRSLSPSPSSSLPIEFGSDCSFFEEDLFDLSSDYDIDYCGDRHSLGFEITEREKLFAVLVDALPYGGATMMLFETPSGFALFTFPGVYCYLPDSVDRIWAEFGERHRASMLVYPKGFVSFEDKSSAITDAGVDKRLVDMINKWHRPGMKLCVGKHEYKRIIESVLKIPCLCCETVMEIMWGVQQRMSEFVHQGKTKLTKEDLLPMSQGLKRFLSNHGHDVKPEMVNEKILTTASILFHCEDNDENSLEILRDAGLHIRNISGIDCEDWDILKLAVAVKVISCPEEELTDFREVLAEDVLSKLKVDAFKYDGITYKGCGVISYWFKTYRDVASNHPVRIAKEKLLGSLVKKAQKAYEAKQAKKAYEAAAVVACEKAKLHGESSESNLSTLNYWNSATSWVGKLFRRSPRLNPKLYEDNGPYHAWLEGAPHKQPKYCSTCGTPMAM